MSEYLEYEDPNAYDEYEDEEEPRSVKHTIKVLASALGVIALTAGASFLGFGEAQAQRIVNQQSSENILSFDKHYEENILIPNAYSKASGQGTENSLVQPLLEWDMKTAHIYLSPTGLMSKIQKTKIQDSAALQEKMESAAIFKEELDNFCLVAKVIEDDKNPMRTYTIVENTLEKLIGADGKKDQEAWIDSAVRLKLPASFVSTKDFVGTLSDENNASNYTQYCYVKKANQSKMEEFLVSAIHAGKSTEKAKK